MTDVHSACVRVCLFHSCYIANINFYYPFHKLHRVTTNNDTEEEFNKPRKHYGCWEKKEKNV